MQKLPEKIDSKYRFVLLAAERAEQLMQGALPRLGYTGVGKPTQTAMAEVLDEAVDWEYGPAPEPEVEETTAEEAGEHAGDEAAADEDVE